MPNTGTLSRYFPAKGFGFIERDDNGPDAFVHIRDARRSGIDALAQGQRFTFDIEVDRATGKPCCVNLREAA
jgi:CspA family cold shock protein